MFWCSTGPARESEVYPRWRQMEKRINAPMKPSRALPGDSAPLDIINTAATSGGNVFHSRGGWKGPFRTDTITVRKQYGSRSQVPTMANKCIKVGVQTLTPRHKYVCWCRILVSGQIKFTRDKVGGSGVRCVAGQVEVLIPLEMSFLSPQLGS